MLVSNCRYDGQAAESSWWWFVVIVPRLSDEVWYVVPRVYIIPISL